MQHTYRKTRQALLPLTRPNPYPGSYDLYPLFPLGDGAIEAGDNELAAQMAAGLVQHPGMVIDGCVGISWDHLREELNQALRRLGLQPIWTCVDCALRPPAEIDALLAPFLGGGGPLSVETLNGAWLRCHYAEAFIIPAAAEAYRLINEEAGQGMVVQASLKHGWFEHPDW